MNSFTPGEQAFVDRHRVARLATAELLSALHVIPIVYARVGDAVYFIIDDKPKHTHTGLKRLRNIEQNPRAALLIDDDDWTSLAYLLIHGRAAVVVDREKYVRVDIWPICLDTGSIGRYMADMSRHGQHWPI